MLCTKSFLLLIAGICFTVDRTVLSNRKFPKSCHRLLSLFISLTIRSVMFSELRDLPKCTFQLTPSQPQPVKFLVWKVHIYTPENSIFDGHITNLLSILCILIVLSRVHAKGTHRLNHFKFGTFIGRSPSDDAASLAVKVLKFYGVNANVKQRKSSNQIHWQPCSRSTNAFQQIKVAWFFTANLCQRCRNKIKHVG